MRNYLIKGNHKMGSKVYLFNLPPKLTCTPTHWCLKGKDGKPACYALRNNFNLPSAVKALKNRYKVSLRNDFSEKIIEEIKKKDVKLFRLHSSGDFYSADYVKKWIEIVKECSKTKFRTTTRRRDLVKMIQELNSLENIIVRESLDDERIEPKMGLKFAALSHLEIAKETHKCLNDCTECGHYCWYNEVDMCFDEH